LAERFLPISAAELDFDTLGRTHMTWTDMRRDISVPQLGRTGKAQDAEHARR
jgi:hypothetical protein